MKGGQHARRAATVRTSSILSQKEKPMRTVTTRPSTRLTLYVAFELGNTDWHLAMTPDIERLPRRRTIPARALDQLHQELAAAKQHFGLPAAAGVASCYEAGRDGFWLHRYLTAH